MFSTDDTIAALASAPGGAARGIVRLSGPGALEAVARNFHPADCANIATLRHPQALDGRVRLKTDRTLPAALFLWPTARSYTRQPLAEIHTFGSPPLLEMLLRDICASGARLARPGEFTLRAFLAGRIDLTQAEAVLGVVDSQDRRQLDSALAQLAGGLTGSLQQLRNRLLDLLADLEAGLDFVDDDIRFVSPDELADRLAKAAAELQTLSAQLGSRGTAQRFPRVALVGWPNVGKSSLFNTLVGDAAAIVSAQAGTTRDYLTAPIDAAGLPVELVDTAGVSDEQSLDEVDHSAQTAAAGELRRADLRLLCLDATRSMNSWERERLAAKDCLLILTKCDQSPIVNLPDAIATSSRTGLGLSQLRQAIRAALDSHLAASHVVPATAIRAHDSLRRAAESIARAQTLASSTPPEELIAAELRTALDDLGLILGAIYTDDLLDRIFSRFCIGK